MKPRYEILTSIPSSTKYSYQVKTLNKQLKTNNQMAKLNLPQGSRNVVSPKVKVESPMCDEAKTQQKPPITAWNFISSLRYLSHKLVYTSN